MKKKAVLEIEFDPSMMIDKEALDAEFNGDLLKAMQWLFEEEGLGIFDTDFELVSIKSVEAKPEPNRE